MQALNLHHVREFDPDRKPHHWGKRKLKRPMKVLVALSECGELRSVWLSYRRQNRYPD
jgi:hypothetical protein